MFGKTLLFRMWKKLIQPRLLNKLLNFSRPSYFNNQLHCKKFFHFWNVSGMSFLYIDVQSLYNLQSYNLRFPSIVFY